jgi:hypothetical protein
MGLADEPGTGADAQDGLRSRENRPSNTWEAWNVPGTLKRLSIATAVAAVIGVATLPAAASAGPVEDLVGGVQKTVDDTLKSVNGLLGGGAGKPSPAPAPAPAPQADGGTTTPGISGTNPHGQGEVLDVTTDAPLLDTIVGTVVVGQSRGEQDASGNYHGNVTVASVSGLGIDISFPTDEGETETSPLDPINQGILDSLCSASTLCLGVVEFTSETDENGSSNSFSTVNADLLEGLVTAGVVESEGNISDDDNCQTAEGESRVASAGVEALRADAMNSSSESEACNDGTESGGTGDSQVLNLASVELLDVLAGCDETAVDDSFALSAILLDLMSGICNGDDTNGAQADSPYNVRKAIGLELLPDLAEILGIELAVDGSTSESHATAPCPDPTDASDRDCPPIDECPDPTDASDPDCPPIDECPDPTDASDPDCPPIDDCPDPSNENDPDCPDITVSPGGPGGPSADDPDENLPFTGADLGTLAAIGLGVMAIGLALMGAADRRRRAVA